MAERREEANLFIALNFKSAYLPGGIGTDPIAIPRLPARALSFPSSFLFSTPFPFLPLFISSVLALAPYLGYEGKLGRGITGEEGEEASRGP